MPCDSRLKPRQTIQERVAEVKRAIQKIEAGLATGRIKPVVGATGGITFTGLADTDRDGVTDACVYRRIMATGSVTAKMAIARAEQLTGRTVDRHALAHGLHTHDGGKSWHHGH